MVKVNKMLEDEKFINKLYNMSNILRDSEIIKYRYYRTISDILKLVMSGKKLDKEFIYKYGSHNIKAFEKVYNEIKRLDLKEYSFEEINEVIKARFKPFRYNSNGGYLKVKKRDKDALIIYVNRLYRQRKITSKQYNNIYSEIIDYLKVSYYKPLEYEEAKSMIDKIGGIEEVKDCSFEEIKDKVKEKFNGCKISVIYQNYVKTKREFCNFDEAVKHIELLSVVCTSFLNKVKKQIEVHEENVLIIRLNNSIEYIEVREAWENGNIKHKKELLNKIDIIKDRIDYLEKVLSDETILNTEKDHMRYQSKIIDLESEVQELCLIIYYSNRLKEREYWNGWNNRR